MYKVAALYEFLKIEDPLALKERIEQECRKKDILGALILAPEGINGTISGQEQNLDDIIRVLKAFFTNMELKYSFSEDEPFNRLRIRVKPEIVTMDYSLVTEVRDLTSLSHRGKHVDSKQWNSLISSPGVIIVDTRNDYEVDIGSFQKSINPCTKSFGEFPNFVTKNLQDKNTKIAMFCTGGVRCEKASAYMKSIGFENVFHLKGGILKYLEDIPPEESLFDGSCFVFDRRASMNHGLQKGEHVFCFSCRHPLTQQDTLGDEFQEGVQCKYCCSVVTDRQRQANEQRQRQIAIADESNHRHLGMNVKEIRNAKRIARQSESNCQSQQVDDSLVEGESCNFPPRRLKEELLLSFSLEDIPYHPRSKELII